MIGTRIGFGKSIYEMKHYTSKFRTLCVCARIFNLNSEVRHLVVQNSKLHIGGSKTFYEDNQSRKA